MSFLAFSIVLRRRLHTSRALDNDIASLDSDLDCFAQSLLVCCDLVVDVLNGDEPPSGISRVCSEWMYFILTARPVVWLSLQVLVVVEPLVSCRQRNSRLGGKALSEKGFAEKLCWALCFSQSRGLLAQLNFNTLHRLVMVRYLLRPNQETVSCFLFTYAS